jgi:ribonuclease HI
MSLLVEFLKDTKVLIGKVTSLRREFESVGGSIEFISGDFNPADLGFHR